MINNTPTSIPPRSKPVLRGSESEARASRSSASRWIGGGVIALAAFALGWFSRPTEPAAVHARAELKAAPTPAVTATPLAQATEGKRPAAAEERLKAAIRSAHAGMDRATRLYEFAQRLREVAPGDFPALLVALRVSRGPETPEMMAMLCSVWATHDGPAAFNAARGLIATDGEFQALQAAIGAWAQREPAAAQEALRTAGLTDMGTDEMAAFVVGWASKDFAAAEAFLGAPKGKKDGEEGMSAAMQRGYEAIARARLEADPNAALQWYGKLDDGLRERLRQPVLAKLAAMDPALANQWLARDASAQVDVADLVPLVRGLQLGGFDQQFAWAKTPANTETREAALMAVVREGTTANLVPLGEWLAQRTDDPSLGSAFSAYAIKVVQKSPSAALTWAQSLDQPELRQRTLNAVVTEWISVNPRAAREWAQQTKLVDWEALVR
ncbi:MAG: hypothetical protein V4773_10970 [Verrucomicrobiota bacterium]